MARPNWEYIRVDVLLPDNPKLDGLSGAAKWALVEMWCYCGQRLTDGFIRDAAWTRFGSPAIRQQILGRKLAKRVSGGYQVHDYLDHQRSRDEVIELREKRRKAGQQGGRAKALAEASARASAVALASGAGTSSDSGILAGNKNVLAGSANASPRKPSSATHSDAAREAESPAQASNDPKQVLQQNASKPVAEAEAEAEADKPLPVAEVPDGPLEGVIHTPFTAGSDVASNGSPPPGPPATRRAELEAERKRQIDALAAWEREHPAEVT